MAQIIQHNIMALNSFNRLSTNNSLLSKNLEKLSSGYKINRAGDDAAGLAISEKMRAQITGLERASDNAQDGISLVQTAEGALTEVHSMLNRMVELATQSANGTYDGTDRAKLQSEVDSLRDEIDRIATETNFNGIKLLDGSMGSAAQLSKVTKGTDPSVTIGALSSAAGATGKITALTLDDTAKANINAAATDLDFTVAEKAATSASFVVDLTGAGAIESAKTYKLTVAGAEVQESAATSGTDAAALATAFNGKTVTIGGVVYTATAAGNKLNFAAAAGANAKITNLAVSLAGGTTAAPGSAPTGSFEATEAKDGTAAGKTLKVSDGTTNWTKDISTAEHTAGGTFTLSADGKGTMSITVGAGSATVADIATVAVTVGTGDTQTLDFAGKTGSSVQGTTITINDKTYEFVKAAGDEATGNNAVVVADDADAKTIAEALIAKIDEVDAAMEPTAALTAGKYKVEDDDNGKITLTGFAGEKIEETLAVEQEGKGLGLQIGDTASQKISVVVDDMGTENLGIDTFSIETEEDASAAIDTIKAAINQVSTQRSDLGAIQNRLEYTINNLATTTENLTSAESRIRDTDMAKEMMAYTKNNVLAQAAQAMLAQANQQPQQVLQLLQ